MFGFLLPMRRLSDRMASLGATVLDLMTSEISRLSAMSSLHVSSSASAVICRADSLESVVQTAARGLVDLLVQGRVGRGGPPAHHDGRFGGRSCASLSTRMAGCFGCGDAMKRRSSKRPRVKVGEAVKLGDGGLQLKRDGEAGRGGGCSALAVLEVPLDPLTTRELRHPPAGAAASG